MIKCNNCSKDLPDGTKFCDNCGAKTVQAPPPPQPMNQTPPLQGSYNASPQPVQPAQPVPVPPTPPAQTPSAYQPPTQPAYQPPTQGAYTAPQTAQSQNPQPTAPQQGTYTAPTSAQPTPPAYQPPTQGAYTPPQPTQTTQAYTPPTQGNYTPPPVQNQPTQPTQSATPTYTPPAAGAYNNQPTTPTQQPTATQPQQPTVQNQNTGTVVATKPKSKSPIIFIIIGVVVLVVFGIIVATVINFVMGLFSDDTNVGVWEAEQITMFGMTMSPEDIYEDGLSLELKSGGNCTLSFDGADFDIKYEIDGTDITLSDSTGDYEGTIEDNVLTIENLLDMGLDIIFVKEGTPIPDDLATGTTPSLGGNMSAGDSYVAPGYGTESTVSAETLDSPSDWYGLVTISNYVGDANLEGEYEAWAYIGSDEFGTFFELYLDGPVDSGYDVDLMSFNIELNMYSFFPIVDDYAWLYNGATLKEEDNTWFSPALTNGVLTGTYDYAHEGESFTIDFELGLIAQDGLGGPPEGTTDGDATGGETTEHVASPPAFTKDQLRAIFLEIEGLETDVREAMTYEDFTFGFFQDNDGEIQYDDPDFKSYLWRSTEDDSAYLYMAFDLDDNGEFTYTSMSLANIGRE